MRQLVLGMALIIMMFPHPVRAAGEAAPRLQGEASEAYIGYPASGQWLQGEVVIKGSTGGGEIKYYEVDFSYAVNPSQTWFLIKEGTSPVIDNVLATWNTTGITDGEYSLRLLVRRADDTTQVVVVNGLRVSNEAPIEAAIPLPTIAQASDVPGKPSTAEIALNPTNTTHLGTPAPLPPNPVEITEAQVIATLGKGVVVSLGSFATLGIYLGLRSLSKKRK